MRKIIIVLLLFGIILMLSTCMSAEPITITTNHQQQFDRTLIYTGLYLLDEGLYTHNLLGLVSSFMETLQDSFAELKLFEKVIIKEENGIIPIVDNSLEVSVIAFSISSIAGTWDIVSTISVQVQVYDQAKRIAGEKTEDKNDTGLIYIKKYYEQTTGQNPYELFSKNVEKVITDIFNDLSKTDFNNPDLIVE